MIPSTIPRMNFGSTGHMSSRVLFGAAALGGGTPERAWELLNRAMEVGVNHIDTAASYGKSELNLAPWLAENRSRVFLATKTGERNGEKARAELELSLERLGTDSVDMIQLHNLVEQDQWDEAHGPGGAVEALIKAKEEGLCHNIGVTGHGLRIPRMHLRSLERYPFASVLVPLNYVLWQIPEYRGDLQALLDYCDQTSVAVQTIKSVARRRWPEVPERRFSWYEPLDEEAAITSAAHWVLQNTQVFLNTSSDSRLLETTYAAAINPEPVSDEMMEAIAVANDMTPLFDGGELERI